MNKKITLSICLIVALKLSAQQWVSKMHDTTENFYNIQQEFNAYWQNKTVERGKGYKAFRRWEWFTEPRVYPSGNMQLASKSKAYEEFNKFLIANPTAAAKISGTMGTASTNGNWSPIGPFGSPANGDAGRITFIRFHPTNSNTIFVGTGAGGLWVSTNGGSTWTTNTNSLSVLGCSDLAIDPTNPNIMYLATGDYDADDTHSVGVLKTTDGGLTWTTTGLTFTVSQLRSISRLLINPLRPTTLFAATSVGMYRSNNSGTTWSVVKTASGGFGDMEYKPADTSVVYAVTPNAFYKTTSGGNTSASWVAITSGLTGLSANRLCVSVTPADANYVYVLASKAADNGFGGLYRSVNSGTSFTLRSSTPNIFGWQDDGLDSGGQGWYDIACGVSPTNKEEIICGGVNSWRSTNGGTSWAINSHWYGAGGNPYVHADLHAVEYQTGSKIFLGTDGGVAVSTNTGSSWTTINGQMNIAQVYRIGQSATNANYLISGHQDNGTNLLNGTSWAQIYGGDGADCFVDWSNNSNLVASYVNGDFQRSSNGGSSWTGISSGITGNAAWVAPIIQDPNVSTTYYCGYQQVFKSLNKGTTWTQMGTISGSSTILRLAAAKSNSLVLYASTATALYKTTNGGSSWTNITTGIPTSGAQITNIAVDNTNPSNVYVTLSGYSAGNKVFSTINGGTSWVNISAGLPNLPANCVVFHNNTGGSIYVGTDVGVYYRDVSATSFVPFMTGLPNVIVNDLEIFYPTGRLRAGTYGRGVWESDLYSVPSGLDVSVQQILNPINGSSSCNTSVIPKAVIVNLGSTTITSVKVLYKMDATATQTLNWTGSLASNGTATVTLNTYSGLTASAHTFSVWTNTPNAGVDAVTANDNKLVTFTVTSVPVGQALPYSENFESTTFPPTNWVQLYGNTQNPSYEWKRTLNSTGIPVTPLSTACAEMDNLSSSVDITNQLNALRTPALNFSTGTANLKLYFDLSHQLAFYNGYYDTLSIYISTNCGNTWTKLYSKGDGPTSTLATVTGTTGYNAFVPTANSQWRRDSVALGSYAGNSSVYLKFENKSGWGANLYLDNINIKNGGSSGGSIIANYSYPTTACVGVPVTFTDLSSGNPNNWNWTFSNGTSSSLQNPTVTFTAAGTYTINLAATNGGTSFAPLTQVITVNAPPTVAVNSASLCVGSSKVLTATGASSYIWSTGSTSNAISVSPTTSTNYTVSGTVLGCPADVEVATVTVYSLPVISVNSSTICSGGTATLNASGASTYTWNTGSNSASLLVSPTGNTPYTVGASSSNGCTSYITAYVVVASAPVITVNAPVICAGQNAVLNASGVNSYTWSNGSNANSISVTPTITSVYTVSGSMVGCSLTATKTTTVTVNPLPLVSIAPVAPMCFGSAPTTLVGSPVGGSFSGTGVMIGTTFDPSVSGIGSFPVTYAYTNINGCVNIAVQTITVSSCTGIEELSDNLISVYPNPTNDVLAINLFQTLEANTSVELFDDIGKLVFQQKNISVNQLYINTTNYTKGIYLLKINSDSWKKSIKIIKE